MSTDNSLSLPAEHLWYTKQVPFLLFRRSWSTCVFSPEDFLPITLPTDQLYVWNNAKVLEQPDTTIVKIISEEIVRDKWLSVGDHRRPFGSHKLYCLVEAPTGLNLQELAKLNCCPVVSYTGYVPERDGTVVVIELLD